MCVCVSSCTCAGHGQRYMVWCRLAAKNTSPIKKGSCEAHIKRLGLPTLHFHSLREGSNVDIAAMIMPLFLFFHKLSNMFSWLRTAYSIGLAFYYVVLWSHT